MQLLLGFSSLSGKLEVEVIGVSRCIEWLTLV